MMYRAFFLLPALLLATSVHGADTGQTAEKRSKPVLSVTTVRPDWLNWPETVNVQGSITPWQEAIIAAETSGLRVTAILAEVGDRVRRGQELARLNAETVETEVAQRKAALALAQANLVEARANADRARALVGDKTLSEQLAQQYLAGEAVAQANVASAEAALKAAQIRLAQTRIAAVDDGVISAAPATLGAVVQPGSELFRLVRQNRLEWRAELTAEQLAMVHAGQHAHLRIDAAEGVVGEVRAVSPTIDMKSRRGYAYVDLPAGAPLRAGMYLGGEIIINPATSAVTLPESALILRDGFNYIFTVSEDSLVRRHRIETGRHQNGRVEIFSELARDARVVESGGAFLNDGDRVTVVSVEAQ